ncbi:YitT family protein [Agathobaculum sp.]|uniref:YitT family protein n=1 Tax=Agathobaculum sp. TaxID=2048138 RepID=UPI002A8307F3|nr:YitT family protein [Agathobaculum sp.]MDY3619277.1 YitT family protein [Agathobaculum sp.]
MSHSGLRERALDVSFDVLGSLALAAGIVCFIEPASIAPGGVSGLALLLKYLWGLPVGTMTLAINVPILYLAFRFLGRRLTLKTLRTVLISSLMIDAVVTPFFPQYAGDRILGSVFGGVCTGAGLGLIFRRGSTTGGTDIISMLVERRFPHVQLGTALLLVDCAILGLSILVFRDLEAGLFGVLALYCQSKVIDGIVYGLDQGRQVLVVSEKNREIAARVIAELERTATYLKSRGAFRGQDGEVLLCVVRVQEFHQLKAIVYEEDPRAFLIACQTEQVHGEGFRPVENKKA